MVGCVIFVIYGFLLPTYSTAFMNGALFIVHVVYLVKDYLARKKKNSAEVDAEAEMNATNDVTTDGNNTDNGSNSKPND